jgi:hypothetical protein
LTYVNIPDADAALFISRYNSAKGPIEEVILAANTLEGVGGNLSAQMDIASLNQGLRWYFPEDSPPRVTSVIPGLSSVTITLIGELRNG